MTDFLPDDTGLIHTDVLVVGSGPTGATTALLLARQGLAVTMITRGGWVSDSPRAHITNQRTMEVLRAVGLQDAVEATAAPREQMANHVLCTTLAGPEIGRVWSWGNDPERQSEYLAASPVSGLDIPQDRLEPILLGEAARLGVRVRFNTKFEALEQDDDGVTVRVIDQASGRVETIRASYVVGADGGQSRVADAIGLPLVGESGISGAMNVRFTADLSKYVAHRPGSLFEVIQPQRPEALAIGMLRMVQPWHDWVAGFVHLGERNSRLTEEEAIHELRQLIGDDSIDIAITGLFPWRINHVIADYYSVGRVFCAGDAVHRHPPMNGLGANTCIQDAFNLAWKIAMVFKGQAGAGLLDSYSVERQPVGKQIIDRAIASWHLGKEVVPAFGIDPTAPQEVREAQFAVLTEPTDEGEARRAAVTRMLDEKAYIFGAHGVEMNQRYESGAVIGDGSRAEFERDPQLYIQPSSDPGARLPHAWVGDQTRTVSTLDLTSPERFTLLTRTRGAEWVAAAQQVATEFGVPIEAVRIGQGGDVTDLYGDFARRTGIGEAGCLLVRPDQHIAWRSRAASPCVPTNIPQHVLEPILSDAAQELGAEVIFNLELVSMRQEADRVISTCRDRVTGEEVEVVSTYAVGADGDNSAVVREIGFDVLGQTGLGHMLNFWVKADLTQYTAHRPGALYQIFQPGGQGFTDNAMFVNVRPWDEWVVAIPYDPSAGDPDRSEEAAQRIVRSYVGDSAYRSTSCRSARVSGSQTHTATGRSCGGPVRTAHCWCAPTTTSRSARRMPRANRALRSRLRSRGLSPGSRVCDDRRPHAAPAG